MTTIPDDDLRARVRAGIAYLNRVARADRDAPVHRSWRRHIQPERLDLKDCAWCILGQIGGTYFDDVRETLGLSLGRCEELGFAILSDNGPTLSYERLTKIWREELGSPANG